VGALRGPTCSRLTRGFTTCSYTIQYNDTLYWVNRARLQPRNYVVAPMVAALSAAVVNAEYASTTGRLPQVGLHLNSLSFPHPDFAPINLVGSQGVQFILGCLMFNFVLQLAQLVTEKQSGIRTAMRTTGLRQSAYWLSWLASNLLWNMISVLLVIGLGLAFRFPFFVKNDLLTYTCLLVAFAWALVPFAFFLSVIISDPGTANSMGFTMFVLATILQAARNVLFERDASGGVVAVRSVLRTTPFYALAKGMFDLGGFSDNEADTGMRWRDIGDYADYTLLHCLWTLVLNFFVYLALTFLLESVLEHTGGDMNLWCGLKMCATRRSCRRAEPGRPGGSAPAQTRGDDVERGDMGHRNVQLNMSNNPNSSVGTAVSDTRGAFGHANADVARALHAPEATTSSTRSETPAIALTGLRKEFHARRSWCDWRLRVSSSVGCTTRRKWWWCLQRGCGCACARPVSPFVAVHGTTLEMRDKELFCMLGSNGAGKTTTLSMLMGLLRPSLGTATVCGKDVQQHTWEVQTMMGVCRQHDTLWDELTAAEHVELYAAMRGCPASQVHEEARRRLRQVSMDGAASLQAGAMSGGMRRRLSLAMALAGDPAVVLLDEPTTGMDPVSQREVWEVLKVERRRRCVVLTTHDMEEADVLADRLCVMHRGKVCCQGTPLQLKRHYGSGFTVTLVSAVGSGAALRRTASGSSVALSRPQPLSSKPTQPRLGEGTTCCVPPAASVDSRATCVASGTRPSPISSCNGARPPAVVTDSPTVVLPFAHDAGWADTLKQLSRVNRHAFTLMMSWVPQAVLVHNDETSLEFLVPTEHSEELAKLLEEVELRGSAHGIQDVQLSLTTLEEVFLLATGAVQVADGATTESGGTDRCPPPTGAGEGGSCAPEPERACDVTLASSPHQRNDMPCSNLGDTPHRQPSASPMATPTSTRSSASFHTERSTRQGVGATTAHSAPQPAVERLANRSLRRRCATHWHGAAALSCLPRLRHKRTMCWLLVAPTAFVVLVFLLQLVVTDRAQQFAGATHQAFTLHPDTERTPLVTAADDFDAELDCPATRRDAVPDYGAGEWLYAVEAGGVSGTPSPLDSDAPRWNAGEYGPRVAASVADTWEAMAAARSAPAPRGFLGRFTRDPDRMVGVKAKVYVERGNEVVVCERRPYVMPLSFKLVGSSKAALEDALFQDFGHTRCVVPLGKCMCVLLCVRVMCWLGGVVWVMCECTHCCTTRCSLSQPLECIGYPLHGHGPRRVQRQCGQQHHTDVRCGLTRASGSGFRCNIATRGLARRTAPRSGCSGTAAVAVTRTTQAAPCAQVA